LTKLVQPGTVPGYLTYVGTIPVLQGTGPDVNFDAVSDELRHQQQEE
jgi:hypothetical protein